MKTTLNLSAEIFKLPFRTSFKQASSVRNFGESIWCEVRRGKIVGLGEGCPRNYVTNETVKSALAWINRKQVEIQNECPSLDLLKIWIKENREEIDQHPAAFCAIETAMLDLFAKEEDKSVEELLGIGLRKDIYSYTGVLSDGGEQKLTAHITRFLEMGFSDFKIKVNGDIKIDTRKFEILSELVNKFKVANLRIRLDANNLWKGKVNDAIQHLSQLKNPLFGVEEPILPKNCEGLGLISNELNLAIILDESLCALSDFTRLDRSAGQFIANLKVSRIGGVIRSMEMVNELKKRNIPIIIGAHVGETSILTRAGMCVANTADQNLVAQEGGVGEILLEKDIVHPSLRFGKGGQINLANYTTNNWNYGWGLSPICS